MDDRALFSAVDLLPTFCEIAGVALPDSYTPDGVSQVAALMGKGSPTREKPLFWKMRSAWPIPKTRPFHWVSYAVVHDRWKLVSNEDSSYVELYDIGSDPFERTDLKTRHSRVVEQLLRQLKAWQATIPAEPGGEVFSGLRNVKP